MAILTDASSGSLVIDEPTAMCLYTAQDWDLSSMHAHKQCVLHDCVQWSCGSRVVDEPTSMCLYTAHDWDLSSVHAHNQCVLHDCAQCSCEPPCQGVATITACGAKRAANEMQPITEDCTRRAAGTYITYMPISIASTNTKARCRR